MEVSAFMGLTEKIGGVYEVRYSFVKGFTGEGMIPLANRPEIENLPDPLNIFFTFFLISAIIFRSYGQIPS